MARDPLDPGTREMPGLAVRGSRRRAKGERFGYARVSTGEQNLDLQRDALRRAGAREVYEEHASGKGMERPELANLMRALREGDTLIVWRLDRLGRSLVNLVQTIENLSARGVAIESVTEKIDTTTAAGKMFIGFVALMAEFERNLISERTHAGLKAARARGRKGGRRKKLDAGQVREIKALVREGSVPIGDIAKRAGIGRTTLYNYLRG